MHIEHTIERIRLHNEVSQSFRAAAKTGFHKPDYLMIIAQYIIPEEECLKDRR